MKMKMKKDENKELDISLLKEGLERWYLSCKEAEHGAPMVLAVYDYMNYIEKHPLLERIIYNDIQKPVREKLKVIERLEKNTESELDKALSKILADVKKKKIKSEKIDSTVLGYKSFKSGRSSSSSGKVEVMHLRLEDIVIQLHREGHADIVHNYAETKKIVGQEYFMKLDNNRFEKYEEYKKEKEKLGRGRELEPWGILEIILRSHRAIYAYINIPSVGSEEKIWEMTPAFEASAFKALKDNNKTEVFQFYFKNIDSSMVRRFHLTLLDGINQAMLGKKLPSILIGQPSELTKEVDNILGKNKSDVRLRGRRLLIIRENEFEITPSEYSILKLLLQSEDERDDKAVVFEPYYSKELRIEAGSESAFRSALSRLRKTAVVDEFCYFEVLPIKKYGQKKQNAYQLTVHFLPIKTSQRKQ